MRCWNCLREVPRKEHLCSHCGQTVSPNPAQTAAAKGRLNYLLAESSEWAFLSPQARQELARVYRARAERLQQVVDKAGTVLWPESDWAPVPAPPATPAISATPTAAAAGVVPEPSLRRTERLEQIAQLAHPPSEASGPLDTPPALPLELAPPDSLRGSNPLARPLGPGALDLPLGPGALDLPAGAVPSNLPLGPVRSDHPRGSVLTAVEKESLGAKVLAEADIRWFHSLGALLVVAAVVGWLRATWDGYGKNLAGMMILSSPFVLHGVAHQMRRSVPLSARLLSILAGLLTAPALLAAEVFDFLPAQVSGQDYWTFAFLVAASLLGWQAQVMKERVPLYVGTLCAVMAGWSQGALVTSVLCLMVGFALAPVRAPEGADLAEQAWVQDLRKIGYAAGLFGCFSTLFLFRPERSPWAPLLIFGAALIYLHLPTLTRDPDGNSENRVALQAAVTVLGMLLMRWLLDVPASGVGLYALMAAGLFLAARPEDRAGALALKIGSVLGFVGLVIGFFSQAPILPGELHPDPGQTLMRFILALAGAVLFGKLSRQAHLENQRQRLGLGAMFSTFGGAYHLFYVLADEPRQAWVLAGFGLWALVWLVAARWLCDGEPDLVRAVCAPVLLACSGLAAVLGFEQAVPAPNWAQVVFWLGGIALLWERGLLLPREADTPTSQRLEAVLRQFLPRLSLWTLCAGLVLGGATSLKDAPLALQLLGLVLLLAPTSPYRQPGAEMVWLMAPLAVFTLWETTPFPAQLLPAILVIVSGWAAPRSVRRLCLTFSALLSLFVLLGSLPHAETLALASLPVAYALACACPAPGREWVEARGARYGFDALFCAVLFLPLDLDPQSPLSLGVTVGVPLLVMAIGRLRTYRLARRVLSEVSAPALLTSGFVWSLFQGPREAGLLLMLGAVWAFTLRRAELAPVVARDLGNGMAILGACWVVSPTLFEPSLVVLATGALLSEGLALLYPGWRPNGSNSFFLLFLTLQNIHPLSDLVAGLSILAGTLALLRGLSRGDALLTGVGALTALKMIDFQLAAFDFGLKTRVLPLAFLLVGVGLWLSLRHDHPSRNALKLDPLACLRSGVALLALPSLLSLAAYAEFDDFLWVLAVGCSCLALSAVFASNEELRLPLRQMGGWVLTGWAAVSLGRAALKLPWQLATLLVGLVLLGFGVMVERRRNRGGS